MGEGGPQEIETPHRRPDLLGQAGTTDRHVADLQQPDLLGNERLQGLLESPGVQRFAELHIHPFAMGFRPEGKRQSHLKAWQRMKTAGEADRKAAAAQGTLQHPHQVQMAEQGHGTGLGETDAEPADPCTRWCLGGNLSGHLRWRNDHVVAQIRTADAAAAAALERAVGDHRRSQGSLEILRQPCLVNAGIDVIPGKRLPAEAVEVIPVQCRHRAPAAHFHLAVPAFQTRLGDRPGPGRVGAIKRFKPGIHPGPSPPGGFNHRG